jgi:hypothetical protein
MREHTFQQSSRYKEEEEESIVRIISLQIVFLLRTLAFVVLT